MIVTTLQISQSQVNPSGSQSTISHLQFQLSSLLQRHRELQSTMEESKNRERERELQIEQQLEELAEKSDQLDIADTKIKASVNLPGSHIHCTSLDIVSYV